jgi:hypothetical protein
MTARRAPQEAMRRHAPGFRRGGTLMDTNFRGAEAHPANDAVPLPATSVHPVAVAIPVAAFAWFVLAAWIAFAGGEMSLVLAAVTFVSVMFFGLLAGGGALARNVTQERAHQRSFREFLDGDVDIATGRITGRVALWQIAMAPIALAVGGTIMIGCAVWVRS